MVPAREDFGWNFFDPPQERVFGWEFFDPPQERVFGWEFFDPPQERVFGCVVCVGIVFVVGVVLLSEL